MSVVYERLLRTRLSILEISGNCNFAKWEFRQLANFPKILAILNESSRNPVRVLDMLTDQTELAMIYESRTVKNTIGETHIWRNYRKPKSRELIV